MKMKRHLEFLLHLILWIIIVGNLNSEAQTHQWHENGYKNIGGYLQANTALWVWYTFILVFKAAFFYYNVYRLFPKHLTDPQRTDYVKPVVLHYLGFMAAELVTFWVLFFIFSVIIPQGIWQPILDMDFVEAVFFPYTFLLLLSYGYWAARQWLLTRGEHRQLQKTSVELALLKTQINPHFLFNTLNNLYAMAIEKNAVELADSIAQLTHMMRYTLYESNTEVVELTREIAYVESYIKLQRLRFTDDQEVPIHFTVEGDPRQVHIAPMLLINFVENAFKHGVSLKQESFINVRVTVLDSQLRFLVENTIHRRDAKEQLEPSGLGLEHARKLLDLQSRPLHPAPVRNRKYLPHGTHHSAQKENGAGGDAGVRAEGHFDFRRRLD
jgi:two-component system LytT family sensor kinase